MGTWNVGGKEPKEGLMLFEWLFPMGDMKTPDIYIIGFQEIVDLADKIYEQKRGMGGNAFINACGAAVKKAQEECPGDFPEGQVSFKKKLSEVTKALRAKRLALKERNQRRTA